MVNIFITATRIAFVLLRVTKHKTKMVLLCTWFISCLLGFDMWFHFEPKPLCLLPTHPIQVNLSDYIYLNLTLHMARCLLMKPSQVKERTMGKQAAHNHKPKP